MWPENGGTEFPNVIFDDTTNTKFKRGQFLGEGAFGKCYELINSRNDKIYAGKAISKKSISTREYKDRVAQEIQIYKCLKHKHVVGFLNFFEDSLNVYIVLELCRKRSMKELIKRRFVITEPETRFYIKQILSGVHYLHQNRIVHRDLKLDNLLLNDELQVKIGDLGLATKIEYDDQRKRTCCGTPNYMAPEVINRVGHSFEVDIWAVGCIMYILLIGQTPFAAPTLQKTQERIKNCDYRIEANISKSAKHMIMAMLQPEPRHRPKARALEEHAFMRELCPSSLPTSVLTVAPRLDNLSNKTLSLQSSQGSSVKLFSPRHNFLTLMMMMAKVLKTRPSTSFKFYDEMTSPASQPTIWVSKWLEYDGKYGFAYQLSDAAIGFLFNDRTSLVLLPDAKHVHYIDERGGESYMTLNNYPSKYDKKMSLLLMTRRHMMKLVTTGGLREIGISRTLYLHQWWIASSAVMMQISNGTMQVNFNDHEKIIMCPLMGAITYINVDKRTSTFKFSKLEKHGCSQKLYEKIRYTYDKMAILKGST